MAFALAFAFACSIYVKLTAVVERKEHSLDPKYPLFLSWAFKNSMFPRGLVFMLLGCCLLMCFLDFLWRYFQFIACIPHKTSIV
jgi:hypothetical protein